MIAELKNVSKSYKNASSEKREVLKGISFGINQGDTIAIVGPSGSGKSTMLNLLGALDLPDEGNVSIDSEQLSNLTADELALKRNKQIGFIFQQHHLLPQLSLLENVLVPVMLEKNKQKKAKAQKKAFELIELVGLSDKVHQKPGELSVGECQRGAVVRALINSPKLLLADEPTGSLDEANAEKLVDLLVDMSKKENIALVMVTHSSEMAAKLDKQYKLTSGLLKEINI